MIQFNLLPSVKIEYIRAKRTKRLVTLIATLVILASLPVVISLSAIVFVWQPQRMHSLDTSIKANAKKLQGTTDINKVLTIQSQLSAIDQLHADKPVASRLFAYLQSMTPKDASLQTSEVDFDAGTMSLTGQAKSLSDVNKLADTLKFTTIVKKDSKEAVNAFSNVVLTNFGVDAKGASFTLTMEYDKAIFDSSEDQISLTIPNIITSRSETERPADLFQANQTPLNGQQQ